MANQVYAWSYSRYADYALCPLKFKLKYIDKLPIDVGPAGERGRQIHDAIGKYLNKPNEAPYPTGFAHHHNLIEELTQFDDTVFEQQWGYDREWKPTGWFTKGANATWLRVILDAGVLYDDNTGEVVDWKTGKKRGSYDDQMEIFSIAVLQRIPHCQSVTTRLAFVDSGDEAFGEHSRDELQPLIAKWEGKVRPMFEDTEFLPRPNDMCKFCDFNRSNGGPCRYG